MVFDDIHPSLRAANAPFFAQEADRMKATCFFSEEDRMGIQSSCNNGRNFQLLLSSKKALEASRLGISLHGRHGDRDSELETNECCNRRRAQRKHEKYHHGNPFHRDHKCCACADDDDASESTADDLGAKKCCHPRRRRQ